MTVKKPDSGKWVRRDSQTGRYVDKKSGRKTPNTIPVKKDSGGTESTGPKKK